VAQNPRVQNDGIQNQIGNEEYDLMAAAADLDEIEEVNANCILMANLQQASSSGTQTDSTPVYDFDGSAKNAGNLAGFNDVIGNQVIQNAAQNLRVQNVRNPNGLMGVQGNGNLVVVHAEGNAAGHNGNQIRCYNCMGVGHFARDCTVRPRRRDAAYLQTQLLIAQKEEAEIQLQAEEYDLMAATADLDEIEKVNANCILMANLQQASSSGTHTDSAPVYDSD
nr:hypothetical protein [Tanacetum cinerariifolium]